MCKQTELPILLARYFDLPRQVSSFFALLILSECTTTQSVFKELGSVEARGLVYQLRKALPPEIVIRSRRGAGYWLDDDQRRSLAARFGVELGITADRITT